MQERLEALPCAWVLVFDADTEEEAVYSMEVEEQSDMHVVLAFEDREEAELYALSLSEADPLETAGYDGVASVQGLDVEALVVTSRDADFSVGVVFRGDLLRHGLTDVTGGAAAPLITGGVDEIYPATPRVSVSITMVPDSVFEGRTADDFLDPSEDPVWVLVHDEGTGDADLFSVRAAIAAAAAASAVAAARGARHRRPPRTHPVRPPVRPWRRCGSTARHR